MEKKLAPLTLACLLALCFAAGAQKYPPATTSGGSGFALLNLDDTVAVHGYDPAAYFTDRRAIKGKKWINERLGGATYYFHSRASRYEFLGDAPKYQPQVGGYCVTSMSQGRLEDIDPHQFVIYQNKLYLFRDPEAKALFWSNPEGIITAANAHYFEIARRKRTGW